jgi:hypothetical protein
MDWTFYNLKTCIFEEMPVSEQHHILAEVAVPDQAVEYYFIGGSDARWVPIDGLIPTRARPSGIISSSRRMADVTTKSLPPRRPLTIEFDAGLNVNLVLDGNSTLFCCRLAGFQKVLCAPK